MGRVKSVVFVSNFFNHHQKALSDALFSRLEGGYVFLETSEITDERKNMGWGLSEIPKYVVDSNSLYRNCRVYQALIDSADVVIIGSAPLRMVKKRLADNKLTFRYSERPLKDGLELWRYPDRFLRWHWRNPVWKPIFMLCASAYAATDYRKFGLYRNKCYKWGYFPEVKIYAYPEKMISEKDKTEILWCGRFLDWKHPDEAVMVAGRLLSEGYEFHLNFIGTGILEERLKQMVQEHQLEDCICFLGQMSPDQVREKMEHAGIYLFTSDRKEGWGAVLNESMNSGCAVIASHAIGSVPFLIEDRENGLLYQSGNTDMLYEKVKYLLDNPQKQTQLGLAAYHTITEVWNAEKAAERLLVLSEKLISGEKSPECFTVGPCSKAEKVNTNWYSNG